MSRLNAYIVEAVRTAGGKNKGLLAQVHPVDLGGQILKALVQRANIKDLSLIDDVIFGCVSQVGAQGGNVARNCVLAAGFPESVPGTTVDRQCGSSLQALHFAAQAVMSGTQDIVIAGGVESMSQIPIGSSIIDGMKSDHGSPQGSEDMSKRYPGVNFSQFEGAELVAEKWNVTREEMETLAYESHRRGFEATQKGYFQREIFPVKGFDKAQNKEVLVSADEGIRWPADKAKMAKLPLLKGEGGRITAALSSQITDGASAVLVVNEEGLRKLGLRPRARVVSLALAGDDPVMMLAAPIPAARRALEQARLRVEDIDLWEVNEAFASVPLALCKALKVDLNRLNVNGGAMALGHALGSTGTRLATTLLHELERRKARYGAIAICEGGGTANALILERIDSAKL